MERKAIITGATGGVGQAVSMKLAEMKYSLLLVARTPSKLREVKLKIQKKHRVHVDCVSVDMGSEVGILTLKKKVNEWGENHVLVNNFGTFQQKKVHELIWSQIESDINLNFKSSFELSQHSLASKTPDCPLHLFFISSITYLEPRLDAVSYTFSKDLLSRYSEIIRKEYAQAKVKVTTFFPGSINTPSWDGIEAPLEAFVQPEDIANGIQWCLNASPGCNVDGIVLTPLNG